MKCQNHHLFTKDFLSLYVYSEPSQISHYTPTMCVYRVLKLENHTNIIQRIISIIAILIQCFNMLFWVASSSRIVRWLDFFESVIFTLVTIFSAAMQLFMKTEFSRHFNSSGSMGTGSCGYVNKVAPPYFCLCFSIFTKVKLNLNQLFGFRICHSWADWFWTTIYWVRWWCLRL